jgi:hypothetical protein
MAGLKKLIKNKMKNVVDKDKKMKLFEIILLLFCFKVINVFEDDDIISDVIPDIISDSLDDIENIISL